MKNSIKHIIFFALLIVIPPISAYLSNEIYMHLYLIETGETRAEQSENYGLAFKTFLVMASTFFVSMIFVIAAWILSTRSKK